jgi:hypothetical protein
MSTPPSQLGPVDVQPQVSLEGIKLQDFLKLQDFSIEIKYPHKHEDDNRDGDEDKMKAEDIQKQLDAERVGHIAHIKAKDDQIKAKDDQIKAKDDQIKARYTRYL